MNEFHIDYIRTLRAHYKNSDSLRRRVHAFLQENPCDHVDHDGKSTVKNNKCLICRKVNVK